MDSDRRRCMNTDSRKSRRQWAGGMDRLLSGKRFVALFGPLDVPAPSELDDALAAIAGCPHTRLTLGPRPDKRVWKCDGPSPVVRQLPDEIVRKGSAAILQHIRRLPGERRPIEVHASQRLIALDVDHGLGDGRFTLELLSALFAHASGGTTPWMSTEHTRLALPRALLRTFALHPSRAVSVLKYVAASRPTTRVDSGDPIGTPRTWSPSPSVAVARVHADAERAVDEWCRTKLGKPGNAAVWLYIVWQALAEAGIAVTDTVIVAMDCRRYLPAGRVVNGNFMFGVDLPFTAGETPSTVADRMREFAVTGLPLAGMAAVSARGLIDRRRPQPPSSYTAGMRVDLMYSDLGRVRSLDQMPWSAADGFIAGQLDPAGPQSISVLNTRLGAERCISISFHDNVIDRQVIDTIANRLSDPVSLLPGTNRRL